MMEIFSIQEKFTRIQSGFPLRPFQLPYESGLNLTKTTQFKVNLSGYYGKQQTPANGIYNMWYSVYKYSPSSALPVYSDGTYGMDDATSDRLGNNDILYDGQRYQGDEPYLYYY